MRAYLSTPGARVVMPAGPQESSLAEQEARAVLAESSPETRVSSTFAPVAYYPPWSSRSERGQMHEALAEALAELIRKLGED